MKYKLVKKNNFYFNFFEKNLIPVSFGKTNLSFNHRIIFNSKVEKDSDISKIQSFELVPNYLDFIISKDLINKKVFQKHGYLANLKDSQSITEYIKLNCKTNFRGNIKRSINRFESSFNINYKMYCGAISNSTYEFLMSSFHDTLLKRFEERNDRNLILDNWNYYVDLLYNRIKNKKASLFVIYNNETPIAFSLNFHFENIFYLAAPTFSVNYSKFSLGNIVIFKNLEWCIENNFDIFDMGYGAFDNKLNWCNTKYNFEHHFISNKKNLFIHFYSRVVKCKYVIINYFILNKITTKFRILKKYLIGEKKLELIKYKFSDELNDFLIIDRDLTPINLNNISNDYLMKPINDFLYLNNEHINNVIVFKIINDSQAFLIKGKNNSVKLILLDT